jgi:hypothetical protein
MNEKKQRKYPRQMGGEEKPSVLKAHRELAHEDRDPIYPPNPVIEPKTPKKKD